MRLCHIVPSLAERHGGPSKSVRALANHAVDAGATVELLATGVRGDSVTPAPDDRAKIRLFRCVTPQWLTCSPTLRDYLVEVPADLIHHHSLWLLTLRYATEASRRHRAPLVISPRGMMNAWAWRHRRWRKRLAEKLIHPGALQHAAGWHATSAEEASDIHALGFRQPVCVAPNGVDLPDAAKLAAARETWLELCPAARSRPVVLFYSRLHHKKRVRELIDAWLSIPRGDWLLLIVGTAEEYTAEKLAAEVADLGHSENIRVFDGAGRPAPYAIASLFVLPSHSENFGLVIAEALAAGVPAVVTDTTPWSDLTPNHAGWCVPWQEFTPTLAQALLTPPAELKAMGQSGRQWVANEYSWSRAASLLHSFYRHLLHA